MLSESEVRKELEKSEEKLEQLCRISPGEDYPELRGYIDGLTYVLEGRLR